MDLRPIVAAERGRRWAWAAAGIVALLAWAALFVALAINIFNGGIAS